MANDISRFLFQPKKHYVGARMQQGRVLLDSDFNENEQFDDEELRKDLLNVIGRKGTPQEDPGFAIDEGSVASTSDGRINFNIQPGAIYISGLRFRLEQEQEFLFQTDFLQLDKEAPSPLAPTGTEEKRFLAFVEAFEQPVSAVEDRELLERGLGASAPDTTVRIRRVARVRLADVTAFGEDTGCEEALIDVVDGLTNGTGGLSNECELVPNAKLTVDFNQSQNTEDLCNPAVEGGYLGAENQAIRVMAVTENTFVWGFDNASPLYRVTLSADGKSVTMLDRPRDQASEPLTGQIIEILPASAVLPNGEIVAGLTGKLARVTRGFDPDDGTLELVPNAIIPENEFVFGDDFDTFPTYDGAGKPTDQAPFFMRVWNQGSESLDATASPTVTMTVGTFVDLGSTGLKVKFSDVLFPGIFWVIAARPETRQEVVPWSLKSEEPPHGPRKFYAPIAQILWKASPEDITVSDCRTSFPSLTAVRGCCTFRVGDGQTTFGDYNNIQDAINALPEDGGQICLLPGRHTGAVNITDRRNITINGCGRRSIVVGDGPSNFNGIGQEPNPVILICASRGVRLQDFTVEATGRFGVQIQGDPGAPFSAEIVLIDMRLLAKGSASPNNMPLSAVHALAVFDLLIEDSRIEMDNQASFYPAIFVRGAIIEIAESQITVTAQTLAEELLAWGGIQIGGASINVTVRDCDIVNGLGHGIALGNTIYVPSDFDQLSEGDKNTLRAIVVPIGLGLIDPSNLLQPSVFPKPLPLDLLNRGAETYIPLSAGNVEAATIEGNTITRFGLSGVSTAGFFENFTVVSIVTNIAIRGNIISAVGLKKAFFLNDAQRGSGGYGGIALGGVLVGQIANNRIYNNGVDQEVPFCGVLAILATDLAIESNSVVNNGQFVVGKTAQAGLRGGIVILVATRLRIPTTVVPINAAGFFDLIALQRAALPAVRIHQNSVVHPDGKALFMTAFGPVMVEGNYLESEGDNAAVALPGFTVNVSPVLFNGVALAPVVPGVAASVLIVNFAFPIDFFPSSFFTDLLIIIAADDVVAAIALLTDGNVEFNDNQVVLDWARQVDLTAPFPSSVALLSFDRVSLHDNHVSMNMHSPATLNPGYQLADLLAADAITGANQVFTNVAIVAPEISVKGNRLIEGRTDAIVSLVTAIVPTPLISFGANASFGGLFYPEIITENVFTHCFLPSPATTLNPVIVRDNVVTFPPAGFPVTTAAVQVSAPQSGGTTMIVNVAPA